VKIYVASSWRNERQPEVVAALRAAGHDVYDFRNPRPGDRGFQWSEIDPEWQRWTPEQFRSALTDDVALRGFESDWDAMQEADCCVLVMPCGRSAHLEAGYFAGAGKRLVILLSDGEPELMYSMASFIALSIDEAVDAVGAIAEGA
jgi:nucleoside 2-deoxyribosyltransferase